MQFVYGNYYHAPNSVYFKSINREWVRSPTGRRHTVRVSWNIGGKLLGPSPTSPTLPSIYTQLELLQLAYTYDNQSAVLLDNNGNETNFIVDSSQTIGGVIVTNPVSHEEIKGADGVTYLRYSVGLSWEILWASPNDVLEFSESLSFHDNQGLPLQTERYPLNASPIIQNVSGGSLFYATQAGQMRQAWPNPQAPAPTYPGLFRGTPDSRQYEQLPTIAIRGAPISYGCRWSFSYVSVFPFTSGQPNFR